MANALPESDACCTPCLEVPTAQIPGPAGADGAAGEDGEDGSNAFTLTTADFIVPAELSNVTITVADNTWMAMGQPIFVQTAGFFEVVSVDVDGVTVTIKNLKDTANDAYLDNVAPGTNISTGVKVSPGGLQGENGASGGDMLGANNLSELTDTTVAQSNLGLGSCSTFDAANFPLLVNNLNDILNVPLARINLGLEIGVDVQAWFDNLDAIGGLTAAANKIPYFTGGGPAMAAVADFTAAARLIVANTTTAGMLVDLGRVKPRYGVLGSVTALNLNSANNDNAVTITATRYIIRKVVLEAPSAAVTTATLGLFTAAGGAGTTVAADQALSGTLTATTKFMELVLQAIAGTDVRTEGTIYLRTGTAEGSARTVNAWIEGEDFS
jgi:hypothetical protein